MEVSKKAIFAVEEPPANINLMVTRQQTAELRQISTRTIDNLKATGRMPSQFELEKLFNGIVLCWLPGLMQGARIATSGNRHNSMISHEQRSPSVP